MKVEADPQAAARAISPIAVRVRRRRSTSSGVTSDVDDDDDGGSPPPDRHLQRGGTRDEEREALLRRHPAVPPRDDYNMVYLVFYLLGMGTLLPWNFFISVNSFWDYKFRNVSLENVTMTRVNANNNNSVSPQQTELQKEFTSYLAIASNVPNAVCVILNALFGQRFLLKFRIFISLGTIVVLFFIIMVLAKANSDEWQREFLEFVLVLVVLINCCTAVYQGGVFGVAGKFPSRYIGSVMAGQAMGGIFPAVVDIGVVSFSVPDQEVGFYCFLTATVVLIFCFLSFSWARRANFFKYHARSSDEQQQPMVQEESIDHEGNSDMRRQVQQRQHRRHSVISLMHHSWQYCLSVYLVFVVTLSVFPAVTVLVQSTQSPSTWTEKYFTPVTCFLLFNVGDYAGRILASWILRPKGRDGQNVILLILSLIRVIFVPIFMLCNTSSSQRHLPVIFASDAAYIIFMTVFAISNGYLGNLCMLLGPKSFSDGRDQELSAMVLVACLVLGTGSGSFLSYPIVSSL